MKLALLLSLILLSTACKKTPEAASASALEKGKDYLNRKDYPHALLEFRIALKSTPNNAEAFYQAALTYLAMLDVPAAFVNLKKAVELNPNHTGAQSRLAELLSASHDPARLREAGDIATNVLKLLPDDVSARNALAISRFELGDAAGAEEALRDSLASGSADSRTVVNLTLMRLYRNDRPGAISALTEGAAKNPNSTELAVVLGRMHAAARNLPAAEKEFRRATTIEPRNPANWATLASFFAATQRPADAEAAYRAASNLGDPKFNHLLAMHFWAARNVDAAIKEFERIAAADPKDRAARNRLVAAYRQSNRESDADRVLQQAYARNPKDREAVLGHALSLARMGQFDDAVATLRLTLSESNDNAEARYLLAKIYAAKRQFRLQQQELDEVLKLSPLHLAARLDLSQSQLALGRPAAALDALARAPKEQQNTLPWRLANNWALLAKGDVPAARIAIEDTLKLAANNEALLQRALLALRSSQFASARVDLLRILAAEPHSVRALDALGNTYIGENNMDAAVKAVAQHAAKLPKEVPLQFAYSLWLSRAGKISEAAATLRAVKAFAPEELSLDLRLAELALASKDLATARQLLTPITSKHPKIARAHMLLGHVESIGATPDAAIERYRAVINLEPENAEALNNLASLLSTKPQAVDEALRFAQKAKELAPADPNVSDTLGWVLYQKGLYSAAVLQLQDAAKSPNPVSAYHLAMAYTKTGNRDRANTEYTRAKKVAPNMPEARQAEELLRRQ